MSPRAGTPHPGVVVTLHVGNIRSGWCPTCKAWTLLVGDMLHLTSDGVSVLGTWSGCEICDDPNDPEASRA